MQISRFILLLLVLIWYISIQYNSSAQCRVTHEQFKSLIKNQDSIDPIVGLWNNNFITVAYEGDSIVDSYAFDSRDFYLERREAKIKGIKVG